MVARILINTHETFFPVLSTIYPKMGDAMADIEYTREFTVFAFDGSYAYFRSKNTLGTKRVWSTWKWCGVWLRMLRLIHTYFPKAMNGNIAT